MRFFFALVLISSLALAADDSKKPDNSARPTGQQDSANITPRVREKAPEPEPERRSNIRIDSTLVLIPVAVTDPMSRFVTGLDKENFKVYEDKIEQEIAQFSSEDAPLSIGVVFDTSGSMGAKLQKSRQAVAQFMKTANPEDEFFLIQFNDRPELIVPFTPDTEEIQNRLTFVQSRGRTALLDGVYMAMNQMKKARNPRKAILIISDGGDNSSRYTESEVKNAVREADVQIYAIGIFEPMQSRGRTPEELSGPALLGEVTEQTGGRHFAVDNLAELPDVAAKIGIELRNQYVLGYSPKNGNRDGKYRRVSVKLVKTTGLPQLKAIFRTGYYAPTQ
ncbi:MAG: VWA domain-containing protein [Acidobacteriia bacterium]|nr:VWA domain-containing protein [Terriglobia bacterium]